MLKKLTYVKLAIDIAAAFTFALLFNHRIFGGMTFHEVAGLAIYTAFITHILLNLQWVKKVTLRLFDRKLPGRTRICYIINVVLLVLFTLIVIGGIVTSKSLFPNLNLGNEMWFKVSHKAFSYLILIIVGVHLGLNWQWVVNIIKNIFAIKSVKTPLLIAARAAVIALLLFGGYQIYSTNYFSKLQSLAMIFNPTQQQMAPMGQGRPQMSSGQVATGDSQAMPGRPQAGMGREKSNSNVLGTIASYTGIMSVFAIATYYLDKLGKRRRAGDMACELE